MQLLKFKDFLLEANISKVIDRFGELDEFSATNMDSYINHFISKGAKRLGGGASAEVLEYKNEVIKIYAPINDPGMTRYLSFCLSNKSNPFTIKINKILKTWATEEDRWIYAIFMENLSPVRDDFTKDLNNVLLGDEFQLGYKFGEALKDDNKFFYNIKSIIMKYSKKSNEKSVDSIINFLKSSIRIYKYSIDFGPSNWMMRGNQLVLIDPFWPDME